MKKRAPIKLPLRVALDDSGVPCIVRDGDGHLLITDRMSPEAATHIVKSVNGYQTLLDEIQKMPCGITGRSGIKGTCLDQSMKPLCMRCAIIDRTYKDVGC